MAESITRKMALSLEDIRKTGNCIGPTATLALRNGLAKWEEAEQRFSLTEKGLAALDGSTGEGNQ